LSDLEDADPYEKNNTDGSDIEINPYEKERRKREDKKSKKKKGLRDKLLDNNDK